MKIFFGTPTKLTVLFLLASWFLVSMTAVPTVAEEREPLMDLKNGGVDFFWEIVPSIVQIYNSGLFSTRGGGSSGSGYVIDREGHLITNYHVASSTTVYEIAFYGDHEEHRDTQGARWRGELVAADAALDLAIIKVFAPPDRFHPVRLGDSAIIQPGDTVVTFGSPGGQSGNAERSWIASMENWLEFYNINLGVMTQVLNFEESARFFWDLTWIDPADFYSRASTRDYGSACRYLFQTDSAINSGNSGGPCLNMFGEAIGTNTWGGRWENSGFSVPVNLLKESITDLLQYGRVRRPWCGISLHPRTSNMNEIYRNMDMGILDYRYGAWWESEPEELLIYVVNPYSPAYDTGIREGDILLSVDGMEFVNIYDVYTYFLLAEIGQEVVVEYERDGHGMPAAVITLDEKLTRYDGVSILAQGGGRWIGQDTRYTMHMTY